MATHPTSDAHRLLGGLMHRKAAVSLDTLDVCFLAGLHLRAEHATLASFDEDQLLDVFEQVCDLVEPGTSNVRLKATNAIQRLRDQRLLLRVDGAGVLRTGEYALTRLAAALVGFFLEDERLTRESLGLLTATLRSQLTDVQGAARLARTDEDWKTRVVGPLRVTVADLIAGIERRQRGLDAQQEEVQAEIGRLLNAEWTGAIDTCEALLSSTTATLRELNEILLRDTHFFVTQLQEVQSLAAAGGNTAAETAAQRVIEHVDRVAAWGTARHRGWSEYYQHVNRYLRDVVRLDPDRAISQRLRELVSKYATLLFAHVVAEEPSIVLMRPLEARIERPPVLRPHQPRTLELEDAVPEDTLQLLDELVDEALAGGARSVAAVTRAVLARLPSSASFVSAGRVAEEIVVRRLATQRPDGRWTDVAPDLEIEDAALGAARRP